MEQPLTAKEDERYNNCVELPEKVELITGLMEDMVSNGKLTRGEVRLVWAQLSDKIKVLEGEAEKAKADGKAKKVSKIQEAIEKMEARRDGLADIKPMGKGPSPSFLCFHEFALLTRFRSFPAFVSVLDQARGANQAFEEGTQRDRKAREGWRQAADGRFDRQKNWAEAGPSRRA